MRLPRLDTVPVRAARRSLAALLAVCLLAGTAGCAEQRAQRALERVLAHPQANGASADDALHEELEAIVSRWPRTRAAERARRELESLDDLANARERGPTLRAWDSVRRVARAAERFREERGRYPRRLRDLVPRYLRGPIEDPWGHPIRYEAREGGYRVVCYGADGLPGGAGAGSDLVAANDEAVAMGGRVR